MKIILSVIVVMLLIGAQNVYAETEYQLGFKRGVSDLNPNSNRTLKVIYYEILKHPYAFYQGWIDGFCHDNPHTGSDADEFTFDCSTDTSQAKSNSGGQ